MLYTLQIRVTDAAVLDGSTLVDASSAGVTVDDSLPGVLAVEVSGAFGSFDPGSFLERGAANPSGNAYVLCQASACSSAGAYTPTVDIIERVSPDAGGQINRETIQDLGTNPVAGESRRVFMPNYLLAVTTAVAGPHVLTFLFKPLTDTDLTASVIEG